MKARSWLAVLSLAAVGASSRAASAEEIIYLPYWQGDVNQIQWNIVDYVMYAFAIPNGDGSIAPLQNPGKLRELARDG